MNNFFSTLKTKIKALKKPKNQKKNIEELTTEKRKKSKKDLFLRLSLKNRILFVKQLAILIRAGVPLLSSLYMLEKQNKSKNIAKMIHNIITDVENGQYLATALGKFRKVFGELTINIISIGEISGTLSDNLDHLVITLKKQQGLKRKVIGASVYPIFIIVATLGITILLTVFLFPKIIPVFKSVNYDLPWTTKLLIFISDSVRLHGLVISIIAILLVVAVFFLLRVKKIRFWFDTMIVTLPFIKNVTQVYNAANICRTMGLLLNSGVVVVRSFQITANTTTNLVYKKALNDIADEVMKGEKISSQIENKKGIFPVSMSQMIVVGESTGKLSETLTYLADIYEEEIDDITKNLSTTLEPMLLIFMGILVGFVAISIITPIYGITQHLTPK